MARSALCSVDLTQQHVHIAHAICNKSTQWQTMGLWYPITARAGTTSPDEHRSTSYAVHGADPRILAGALLCQVPQNIMARGALLRYGTTQHIKAWGACNVQDCVAVTHCMQYNVMPDLITFLTTVHVKQQQQLHDAKHLAALNVTVHTFISDVG